MKKLIIIFFFFVTVENSKASVLSSDLKEVIKNAEKCIENIDETRRLKILNEGEKIIKFYVTNLAYEDLDLFLYNYSYCYSALATNEKKKYLQKIIKTTEFLIDAEINKKTQLENKDKNRWITHFYLELLSDDDIVKKPLSLKVWKRLFYLSEKKLFPYNSTDLKFILKFNFYYEEDLTIFKTNEDYLKLETFFLKNIELLNNNLNQSQEDFYTISRNYIKLIKKFETKKCKSFLEDKILKTKPELNFYSSYVDTFRSAIDCFQNNYEANVTVAELLKVIENLEKEVVFFLSQNNSDENKNKLQLQHLEILQVLLDLNSSFLKEKEVSDLIFKLEKNLKIYFSQNSTDYIRENTKLIKIYLTYDIKKADDEIEKNLKFLSSLKAEDNIPKIFLDLSNNDKNHKEYKSGLNVASLDLNNLKFENLYLKSKINSFYGKYSEQIKLLEFYLEHLKKNFKLSKPVYKILTFEQTHTIPNVYLDLINSTQAMNDLQKFEKTFNEAEKYCNDLEKIYNLNNFDNKNINHSTTCREIYISSIKTLILIKHPNLKSLVEKKILPLFAYLDETDFRDFKDNHLIAIKRNAERNFLLFDYFIAEKSLKDACQILNEKIYKKILIADEYFSSTQKLGALTMKMACNQGLSIKDDYENLMQLVDKAFISIINDLEYLDKIFVSNFKSEIKGGVKLTDLFGILIILKEFHPEYSKFIDEKLNYYFSYLQLQDAFFVTNFKKNFAAQLNSPNEKDLLEKKYNLILKLENNKIKFEDSKNVNFSFEKYIETRKNILNEIDKINEKMPETNKNVKINFSKRYTIKDIQENLGYSEALVYYDSKSGVTLSTIITKDKSEFNFAGIKTDKLLNIINKQRNSLEEGTSTLVIQSLIFEKLFKKNYSFLKDNKIQKIYFILDKNLSAIPFEMLITNLESLQEYLKIDDSKEEEYFKNELEKKIANPKFLIEDFSVSYFPSIQFFIESQNYTGKITKESFFLGFGDPAFNSGQFSINENYKIFLTNRGTLKDTRVISQRYKSLPGSREEINIIKSFFPKNDVFLNNSANEKTLKNLQLEKYDIINFATHAEVSGVLEDFNEPFLVLTPPDKPSDENDGIVTASEIAKLNLNAKLVILSACNTASKKDQYADGFSGLIQSFFIAGAESVVATHWQVEDNASKILMTKTFDKIINQNIKTSDALRQTKIEFINGEYGEKYRHPKYWAPYVLIGR